MRPRRHWLDSRIEHLRTAAERGATMVEYALVVALLAVGSLVVIDSLGAAADDEVNNQAVCVSDRPPPTDVANQCEFAPTPTDVVTPDPNVVPPTTAAPNPNPDVYAVSAGPASEVQAPTWTVVLATSLTRTVWQDPPAAPEPTAGTRIRARIQMKDPNNPSENLPDPGFTDCVTDAAGECELRFLVPFPDVDEVTVLIIGVDSPNPPADYPPLYTYTRPAGW